MGENDDGVVFEGNGDTLAALVAIVFQVNTLGLCDTNGIDLLLSLGVVERGDVDQQRETCFATVSVFLPAANLKDIQSCCSQREKVCSFVARLGEANVNVECTAVAWLDINVREIKALAMSLGGTSFWKWRNRSSRNIRALLLFILLARMTRCLQHRRVSSYNNDDNGSL